MFIQVPPKLVTVDIYTGRTLWESELPKKQISEARSRLGGGLAPAMDASDDSRDYRYVATEDCVYLLAGNTCYCRDARTGTLLSSIESAAEPGAWRDIRVSGSRLILATRDTVVCIDRTTEEVLWRHKAEWEVADVAIGGAQMFVADADLPDPIAIRRGKTSNVRGRLVSLNLEDGAPIWRSSLKSVKGQTRHPLRLAYSKESGIVVSVYGTFDAFDGKTGTLLCSEKPLNGSSYNGKDWRQWNQGQPLLFPDRIVGQYGDVYNPRTGKAIATASLWNGGQGGMIRRGCSRVIGSQHLLPMRSAFAAFWDLQSGRSTPHCRNSFWVHEFDDPCRRTTHDS